MKTKSYDGNGLPVLLSQGELAVCTGERRLRVFTGQIILQVKGVVCRRQNPDVGIGQNVNVNVFYRIQLLFFQNEWLFLLFYTVSRDKFAVREDESKPTALHISDSGEKNTGSQCDCRKCQNDFFTFLHVFFPLFSQVCRAVRQV